MEENERYEQICKHEFGEIKDLLHEINQKLFKGNGQPPLTIQIDRLNTFKKVSTWFIGLCVGGIVILAVRLIYIRIVG